MDLAHVRYLDQTVPTLNIGDIARHTVTIKDDGDAGTMQFASTLYTIMEPGNLPNRNTTQVFTVTRTGREWPSGEVLVSYRSHDGSAVSAGDMRDFESVNSTLAFGDGESWRTFEVVINDDQEFIVSGACGRAGG